MGRPVVRIFDINIAGGAAILPVLSVTANGRPLARHLGPVTSHPLCPLVPIHCTALAALPGSFKVTAGGAPVVRVGDIDTCGDPRLTGSLSVIAG